ncbi:MAG: hypothetical protein WBN83_12390 [Desulfoprunum sp.]|uniref:hypothetical protein n=1 Tax=Desulfoprunum sp. TaxID=2020866 RepID=UPI003C780AF3
MKSLVLILMTLICFPARGTAAEPDFPWELFLPAITKMGSNLPLSCNDIAGCYNGIFTDSCPGFSLEGRINIALQNDCTFTVITNSGIHANGKFTKRDGNTYTGSGQTDSAGCGAFNIVMGDLGTSITANYKYVNGLTGSVPNASSGICKSANRLNTEMLTGTWRLTYKIGDSTYIDDYKFNINDIEELASSPGVFILYGVDKYDDIVYGGYSPDISKFEIIDPSVITGWYDYYQFLTPVNGKISGCEYFITEWSSFTCNPMTGVRLSL